MPYSNFIELNVDGGSLPFRYSIATPTNPDAKTINRGLPTVLFLHPVFIGQEAFISKYIHTTNSYARLLKANSAVQRSSIASLQSGHIGPSRSR